MLVKIFRFEDFELDSNAYQLRRAGRTIRLERIPLDLLFLLAERRGQLVTRQEIIERIWGKDVFVDSENSVNTAVRKIRQALKDNPVKPRLLHTVPGKGYRFAPPGIEPEPAAGEATSSAPSPGVLSGGNRGSPHWPLWLGAGAAILLSALAVRSYIPRHSGARTGKVMLVVLPFLNLSGDPNQEYFADGMTEEMITQLGSLDPGPTGRDRAHFGHAVQKRPQRYSADRAGAGCQLRARGKRTTRG
jgi:DNA-binding winged helix-turn-helix (wHTH) protein